jgi:hypothetical protein
MKSRIGRSRRAQSLIQILATIPVIIVPLLALSNLVRLGYQSNQRSSLQASVLELESRMIASLTEPSTFEAVRTQMRNGQAPPSAFPLADSSGRIAEHKTAWKLDHNLQACSEFGRDNCRLKTEYEVRCTPADAENSAACWMAYRVIGVLPDGTSVLSGAPTSQRESQTFSGFADQDFTLPISFDGIQRDHLLSNCDGTQSLFMVGFNRDTGARYCAKSSASSCPIDQFAIGLDFAANGFEGEVLPKCQASRGPTCPPNYALLRVATNSFDARVVQRPQCVFLGKPSTNWLKDYSAPDGINATVCPKGYVVASATCAVETIEATPGQCPSYVCGSNPVFGPTGAVVGFEEVTCSPPPNAPNTSYSLNQTPVGSRSFGCSINYPTQTCGAKFRARVQISGTCALALPEIIDGT